MIPLEQTERKRLFRQRKYVSVDVPVKTVVDVQMETVESDAHKQEKNKDTLNDIKGTHMLSHSAEARLDAHKGNPEIHVSITDVEPGVVADVTDVVENDDRTEMEDNEDPLHEDKHQIKKDYSLESTYSTNVDDGSQSNLSSQSSQSTQVSETMPGHWINSVESFSDKSKSDSELSTNEQVDNKKVLSISDSEECDTDLEIDPNFGKGICGNDDETRA